MPAGGPVTESQLQPRAPNGLGSAPAGAVVTASAASVIAALAKILFIVISFARKSLASMSWTECRDADADEKAGVVTVQTALLHHVVGDVLRGSALIEVVADLMAGLNGGL